ncbi:hypothetical protein MINTM008_01160 [Mycobacterium intracellulare]|nr:hypothetical protein MINTM006_01140 [Mycobacterium intracellulare]BCO70781.1 hypothetical protein MINTM008_01160 [Mycobacterium intracellulare]BCO76333.1 hypothetical protein MINTM009_01150 [Mycobacterium intracellulare]BCP23763.1 hypothetical protein MINTM025_01190 [Mycobacterium intracellulare]BCP29146.1 hypothetical protein MINTM026_01160 [Mycobacterium intracellulare]
MSAVVVFSVPSNAIDVVCVCRPDSYQQVGYTAETVDLYDFGHVFERLRDARQLVLRDSHHDERCEQKTDGCRIDSAFEDARTPPL